MSATLKILGAIDSLVIAAIEIHSNPDAADPSFAIRHVATAIARAEDALDALDGERRAILDARRAAAVDEYNRDHGGEQ